MSTGQLTSDQSTMDIHLQTNPQLHFRVNGGANSRSSEDEALQFLSQEEQDCIQFFEETIDSLEESLNEEERIQETALAQMSSKADGPTSFPAESSPIPGSSSGSSPGPSFLPPMADTHISPKDQDIIDLVQREPDLVQTKEPAFDPTKPGFQSMVRIPDSHFEVRSKRDLMDTLPSEYNPPLPSSSYGAADNLTYHPAGSVPTPVLVAQNIAKNQGGAPINLFHSAVLRRGSLDSDKPPSFIDHPSKQGPPTFTKPSRFPSNISVMLGSKESHNQSLANVNIHERRTQMLANLTGTCHPLEEHTSPEKGRNVPTRSVSFRDPTPDKSRMEALSKLGLNRNRAMSGGSSPTPTSTTDTGTSEDPPIPATIPTPAPSQTLAEKIPETVLPDPISSPGDKTIKANPSPPTTVTQSTHHPPPPESEPPFPPPPESEPPFSSLPESERPFPPPPDMATMDFNTYGVKTIEVNPSASNKSEPPVTAGSHDSKAPASVVATLSDYNSYGGKSKVMTPTPAPASITRSDLPDILSSHIDKSRVPSSPTAAPVNIYGGKTRSITPSRSSNPTSHSLVRTPKAPAPSPAPKPSKSFHGPFSPQRAVGRPPSPEPRRRSSSKPAAFRSQGITVQFSGRGATDESRREALRKLGLLKDTC